LFTRLSKGIPDEPIAVPTGIQKCGPNLFFRSGKKKKLVFVAEGCQPGPPGSPEAMSRTKTGLEKRAN